MAITLNGTTGITTPAIDNQGNLTVDGALNATGLSASTSGLLTVPSGASIYTVGSGTFGLNVAGELTIASGRDNGGDTIVKTSNTERMRIDGAGRVTMPYQPAFLAMLGSNQTGFNNNNSETTVNFTSEIFDQNSDFNTGTKTFTAPVTGKYQLNIAIRADSVPNNITYLLLRVKTSNREYLLNIFDTRVWDTNSGFYSFTGAVLADMDQNDTAYVLIKQNGGTSNAITMSTDGAYFSGYLVA